MINLVPIALFILFGSCFAPQGSGSDVTSQRLAALILAYESLDSDSGLFPTAHVRMVASSVTRELGGEREQDPHNLKAAVRPVRFQLGAIALPEGHQTPGRFRDGP